MIAILVAFVLGLLCYRMTGMALYWMALRVWNDDPSEVTQRSRMKFFGRMTYDQLREFQAAMEAELARRRP